MSEYQYYEFQVTDRPLSEADRQALRNLSTRTRITATGFTNSYEWGDFKDKPAELDLHLYLANWWSRRLMIRSAVLRVLSARTRDGKGRAPASGCASDWTDCGFTPSAEHPLLSLRAESSMISIARPPTAAI
jgi:hypothetical protein